MLMAVVDGARAEACPGGRGTCPTCNEEVIAKCGDIMTWHWAHRSADDCDSWSEGESPWHSQWKLRFPPECREVVIGPHRADVQLPNGAIFELQRSHISPLEVLERERFYDEASGGRFAWILCGDEFRDRLFIKRPYRDGGPWSWEWRRPRRSFCNGNDLADVVVDFPMFEYRRNDGGSFLRNGPWTARRVFGRRQVFLLGLLDECDAGLASGIGQYLRIRDVLGGALPRWRSWDEHEARVLAALTAGGKADEVAYGKVTWDGFAHSYEADDCPDVLDSSETETDTHVRQGDVVRASGGVPVPYRYGTSPSTRSPSAQPAVSVSDIHPRIEVAMTPIEEFSAMVQRVEAELVGSGAGYTPRIRELEGAVDAANLTHDREAITASIRAVEVAWRTEIARSRRTAQGAPR